MITLRNSKLQFIFGKSYNGVRYIKGYVNRTSVIESMDRMHFIIGWLVFVRNIRSLCFGKQRLPTSRYGDKANKGVLNKGHQYSANVKSQMGISKNIGTLDFLRFLTGIWVLEMTIGNSVFSGHVRGKT